uniref:Uncharacterized protein n=1 Tax=Aplanochytrium stocchinoi TaxID=215587 RepID=A0A7S3PLW9_9STRA|mmetsp:Transcript_5489/g.6423  ORF Transcript_5489/g.6423 Transcript_5489/m.6423 type:complete len:119 (-) Transcript_5489:68-424(-)
MEKENTRSQQGSSSGAATASELSEIENEKENMFPSAKKARIVSDFAVKPTAAIITEDISNGQEPVPIRVVNETGDGDVLPEDFKYINRWERFEPLHLICFISIADIIFMYTVSNSGHL